MLSLSQHLPHRLHDLVIANPALAGQPALNLFQGSNPVITTHHTFLVQVFWQIGITKKVEKKVGGDNESFFCGSATGFNRKKTVIQK
jgi:hypothetical protein